MFVWIWEQTAIISLYSWHNRDGVSLPRAFHQRSTLTFIYMLPLPEGRKGDAGKRSIRQCSLGNRREFDKNNFHLVFSPLPFSYCPCERQTIGRGVGTLQGDALFPQSENLSHFSLTFPFFATVVLHLTSVCLSLTLHQRCDHWQTAVFCTQTTIWSWVPEWARHQDWLTDNPKGAFAQILWG